MGVICAMACTHCKGRLGVRLAPWISCLPTTIPDQYLVTRRQGIDQNGYLCSVSLYICLLYLIVLLMNVVLCLWLTRGARSEELLSRTEMGCCRSSTKQRETLGALVCTGRYIGMCRACLFVSGLVRAHAIGISRMSRPKPIVTFGTRCRLLPLAWRQYPRA